MTNEERRQALARARREALRHADDAETTNYEDSYEISRSIHLANMWANVAQAMKVGPAIEADGTLDPVSEYGIWGS